MYHKISLSVPLQLQVSLVLWSPDVVPLSSVLTGSLPASLWREALLYHCHYQDFGIAVNVHKQWMLTSMYVLVILVP